MIEKVLQSVIEVVVVVVVFVASWARRRGG